MDLSKWADFGLQTLKEAGADMARCSVSYSETREFNYLSDRFTLYRTKEENRISMASIEGGRYAQLGGNELSEKALRDLAEECVKNGKDVPADECRRFSETQETLKVVEGPQDCDEEKLFMRAREFCDTVHQKYPTIVFNDLCFSHNLQKKTTVFSSGSRFERSSGCYMIVLIYTAKKGEKSSSFYYRAFQLKDLDKPLLECDDMEVDLAMLADQWNADSLGESFEGPVLMSPACVYEMLHYVIDNFCTDVPIMQKTSPWIDALGKSVASDELSIELSPRAPEFLGGSLCTSDGRKAENECLMDRGVLRAFHLSDYAARKTDLRPAANSDGISYLKLAPGTQNLEELIRQIDKGILMLRFSGGMPAANGDFSGVVKNGFLIENGKILRPVNEVMFSGNLAQMVRHIGGKSAECWGTTIYRAPWISFEHLKISSSDKS